MKSEKKIAMPQTIVTHRQHPSLHILGGLSHCLHINTNDGVKLKFKVEEKLTTSVFNNYS